MHDVSLPHPYLLFLGDTTETGYAKTAFGLRDWAPQRCVGEFSLPGATVTTGLPFLTPAQAHASGARAMVIGVANAGGFIPPAWIDALVEAMRAGLDLIGGMHTRLRDIPELREVAAQLGRRLIDVREPPARIPIATGWQFPFPKYFPGCLALSMVGGAYIAETIRAGIEAVPRPQIEAGQSLGWTRLQIFRHVIVFQALRTVYPALASMDLALAWLYGYGS